jgi:hypothetical protein
MKNLPPLKFTLSNGQQIEFPFDSMAGVVALEATYTPDALLLALLLKTDKAEYPLLVGLPKRLIPIFLRRVREEVRPFVAGDDSGEKH